MLSLFLLAVPMQSQVWVVDDSGGPGVDFTALPAAIAAAAPGDVLLIRSGSYAGVDLSTGLTLIADQGAVVSVGDVRVDAVPAGQHVSLVGLRSSGFAWLEGCGGTVWIEDCRFEPPDAQFGSDSEAAVNVLDCADVVVVDTVGVGRGLAPAGMFAVPQSTPGLRVTQSAVHVLASSFEGGFGGFIDEGGPGSFPIEVEPAAGAVHESGELFALASTFTGGQGHGKLHPYFGSCVDAPGGPGLTALAPVHVRDTQLVGGPEGFDLFGFCPPSSDAPAWTGAPPVELTGESIALDVPSPIRENGSFDVTMSGSPGVLAILGLGLGQDAMLVEPWGGGLVIAGPYLILPPLAIPASGTLTLPISLLDLGPSVESLTFFAQAAAMDAAGAFTVNDATVSVLLDDQF